jgi:hypothetical protein
MPTSFNYLPPPSQFGGAPDKQDAFSDALQKLREAAGPQRYAAAENKVAGQGLYQNTPAGELPNWHPSTMPSLQAEYQGADVAKMMKALRPGGSDSTPQPNMWAPPPWLGPGAGGIGGLLNPPISAGQQMSPGQYQGLINNPAAFAARQGAIGQQVGEQGDIETRRQMALNDAAQRARMQNPVFMDPTMAQAAALNGNHSLLDYLQQQGAQQNAALQAMQGNVQQSFGQMFNREQGQNDLALRQQQTLGDLGLRSGQLGVQQGQLALEQEKAKWNMAGARNREDVAKQIISRGGTMGDVERGMEIWDQYFKGTTPEGQAAVAGGTPNVAANQRKSVATASSMMPRKLLDVVDKMGTPGEAATAINRIDPAFMRDNLPLVMRYLRERWGDQKTQEFVSRTGGGPISKGLWDKVQSLMPSSWGGGHSDEANVASMIRKAKGIGNPSQPLNLQAIVRGLRGQGPQ